MKTIPLLAPTATDDNIHPLTAQPQNPPEVQPDQDGLRRDLSFLDSTMINAGSMIGSGIYLVPAAVAVSLDSFWLIMAVWIIGGIVSLFGALSVAELGALFPRAGGQYVYLREAFGPVWGFLWGWTAFAVIVSAAVSAVAVGFATYLGFFLPLSPTGIKLVAMASIAILTAVNCIGVKAGALVQNVLTFTKLAMLGAIIIAGCLLGTRTTLASPLPHLSLGTVSQFGLALVAVLWSYDGWVEITYAAGEVRNPERNIPRSVIASTALVMVVYLLVNYAFIAVLSVGTVAGSTLVAADTATAIVGPAGASIAAIGVIVATLGCNNGFILTGARIYYAMAREKVFFKPLGRIHPRFRTPLPSLVAQGVWACLLVLTGTFSQLFTCVMFASWVFYALTAGAVIVLRRSSPGLSRSYRTWGYPVTPIVFILFSVFIVVNTLIEDPRDSAIGLGIILLGLPAYYYWRRGIHSPQV